MKLIQYGEKMTGKGPKFTVKVNAEMGPSEFRSMLTGIGSDLLLGTIWAKDDGEWVRRRFNAIDLEVQYLHEGLHLVPVDPEADADEIEQPKLPDCKIVIGWTLLSVVPSSSDAVTVFVTLGGVVKEVGGDETLALQQYVQFDRDLYAEFSAYQLDLLDEAAEKAEKEAAKAKPARKAKRRKKGAAQAAEGNDPADVFDQPTMQ